MFVRFNHPVPTPGYNVFQGFRAGAQPLAGRSGANVRCVWVKIGPQRVHRLKMVEVSPEVVGSLPAAKEPFVHTWVIALFLHVSGSFKGIYNCTA